jgi:hypothetical protein
MVGLVRIFIRNYAHRIFTINKLTKKDEPFEWGQVQQSAQNDIKQAVLESPALQLIDYKSEALVILAVDTSHIAISFYLCQRNLKHPKARIYNRFGSITLNK